MVPSQIPYELPITIGSAPVGTVTLIVGAQTITFPTIRAQSVGTPLSLNATTSSGLTIGFSSSTTSVCTLAGSTATFLIAGTCTITASQAGSSAYAAASATQSFSVSSSPVSVSLPASTLAQGNYNAFPATISGDSSAPSNLGLGGISCVNIPGCTVSLGAGGPLLNFEFLSVTTAARRWASM